MGWLVRIFFRIALFPLWVILGVLQAVGNIVIGLGNFVFYILSGLCFLTAVVCIGLMGETLMNQRMIIVGGFIFGLLPLLTIGALLLVTMAKVFVTDIIFG